MREERGTDSTFTCHNRDNNILSVRREERV
jgi:hypothetical protein